MSVAPAVYTRLSGHAPLAAIVGDRIWPVEAPAEASRPYVVFLTVSSQRLAHLGGPSMVANPRVQIDAYAASYADAAAIARLIRDALDGWSGTAGGIEVLGASCVDQRELQEDAANPPLARVSQDFSVWHRE